MADVIWSDAAEPFANDVAAFDLDIDPKAAQLKKAQRDTHYNVVVAPALRAVGFAILALFVLLHQQWISNDFSWDEIRPFLFLAGAYTLLSWGALASLYTRVRSVHLGMVFLTLDICIWTLAIYFSGGEQSLLFFILILRPIDHLHLNVKHVVAFAHFSALCYVLLIAYLYGIEHRPLSLPTEGLKAILIYGTGLYIAMAARPADRLRKRSAAAVRMARNLIQQLQAKSQDLTAATEEAKAASHAKSQFLANMSHEIRTPMNGVLGMLGLLKNSALTEQQTHFVDAAYRSAEALLDILNDILDFSKIEAGKFKLSPVDFNLRDTVEEAIGFFAEQAHRKGIELVCQIDAAAPTDVRGDPVRLRQILTNLIGNAIKFTDHGEVVVTALRLEAACEDAINLEISVRDTGIGIPSDQQPHLFDAFTQADSSTTRAYGGTGLGLAIAKQLTEMMGGDIEVESAPGQGATFRFNVQLEPSAARGQGAVSPLPAPLDMPAPQWQAQILLAEDSLINQEVASQMLAAFGCQVHCVVNGREALHAVRQSPYDLVLMDCQMPEMDGFAATQAIRQHLQDTRAAHLPIIALTAYAMADDRERCLAAGMDDYLSKPFTQAQLAAILGRWLAPPAVSDTTPTRPENASAQMTQPEGTSAEYPLDMGAIHQLRDLGQRRGKDVLGRVARLYLSQTPQLLATLRDAVSQQNAEAVCQAAHAFKSTNGNVGALSLAALCQTLESQGASQDLTDSGTVLRRIETEYALVQDALRVLVQDTPLS